MQANEMPVGPFGGEGVTLQIQSVLYHVSPKDLERALESLERAADMAIFANACSKVHIAYGDCSPAPCLSPGDLKRLQDRYQGVLSISYDFFGANLGSARGHNTLADKADADFLLILNPDVVVAPRVLLLLLEPFAQADVGMAEAKQLPIEHPKDYDRLTGETSWAATACAMIPKRLFDALGGFDADTFFLYCDDVDFSWQVRYAGFRVIFQPAAVVFHDKRLSDAGGWQPSASERYYSAEAALLLAYKWSRPDIVKTISEHFAHHGDEPQRKALAEYTRRAEEGRLPTALDPQHKVGEFVNWAYANHRFTI